MLKVIDNLVSDSYATMLENMCKKDMDWYIEENISGVKEDNSPNYKNYTAPGANYDGPQFGFGHWALDHYGKASYFYDKVLPIMYFLEQKENIVINKIHRVRIALTTSVGREVQHHPHIDMVEPHKVLLYYVNDSDGDTFIFNEKYTPENHDSLSDFTIKQRVTPKKNRAILFDGLTYHNSSKPVENISRYIINIDFE